MENVVRDINEIKIDVIEKIESSILMKNSVNDIVKSLRGQTYSQQSDGELFLEACKEEMGHLISNMREVNEINESVNHINKINEFLEAKESSFRYVMSIKYEISHNRIQLESILVGNGLFKTVNLDNSSIYIPAINYLTCDGDGWIDEYIYDNNITDSDSIYIIEDESYQRISLYGNRGKDIDMSRSLIDIKLGLFFKKNTLIKLQQWSNQIDIHNEDKSIEFSITNDEMLDYSRNEKKNIEIEQYQIESIKQEMERATQTIKEIMEKIPHREKTQKYQTCNGMWF